MLPFEAVFGGASGAPVPPPDVREGKEEKRGSVLQCFYSKMTGGVEASWSGTKRGLSLRSWNP